MKIKLIGVKPKPEKNAEAINFLKEKLKGQKVFIKFDDVKYDDKNNLLCYLYLWNKTFINAHLIKNGLVDVDTSLDYKYKTKFLKLNPQNFLNMSPHFINLANQYAQGTRPKIVGQLSELIQEFYYLQKKPDAIKNATEKFYKS